MEAATAAVSSRASLLQVELQLAQLSRAEGELEVMTREVTKKVTQLHVELAARQQRYKREVRGVEQSLETCKGCVGEVEGRMDKVSTTGTRIGDRLQTADSTRARALEVVTLLSHLHTFGGLPATAASHGAQDTNYSSMLPACFWEEKQIGGAALLTQKLLGLTLAARGAAQRSLLLGSLSHRNGGGGGGGVPRGTRSGVGGPGSGATPGSLEWATWQVEEYASWLESRVVARFDAALAAGKTRAMAECARTMGCFQREKVLVQRYIRQLPILQHSHSDMAWVEAPLLDSQTEAVAARLAPLVMLCKEVTAAVQGQADKMQRVFPDSASAMQALVQGVIDARVIPAVDRLLCGPPSDVDSDGIASFHSSDDEDDGGSSSDDTSDGRGASSCSGSSTRQSSKSPATPAAAAAAAAAGKGRPPLPTAAVAAGQGKPGPPRAAPTVAKGGKAGPAKVAGKRDLVPAPGSSAAHQHHHQHHHHHHGGPGHVARRAGGRGHARSLSLQHYGSAGLMQGHLRLLASIHSIAHATAHTVSELLTAPRQSSAAVLDPVPRVSLDPSARPLDLAGLPARLLQPFLEGYPASELAWLERHAQERVGGSEFELRRGVELMWVKTGFVVLGVAPAPKPSAQHSCDCSSMHRRAAVKVLPAVSLVSAFTPNPHAPPVTITSRLPRPPTSSAHAPPPNSDPHSAPRPHPPPTAAAATPDLSASCAIELIEANAEAVRRVAMLSHPSKAVPGAVRLVFAGDGPFEGSALAVCWKPLPGEAPRAAVRVDGGDEYLMDGVDSLVKRSIVLDYVTPGSTPVPGPDPVSAVPGSAASLSVNPNGKAAGGSSLGNVGPLPGSGAPGEVPMESRSGSWAGGAGSGLGPGSDVPNSQGAVPAAGTARAAAVFVRSKIGKLLAVVGVAAQIMTSLLHHYTSVVAPLVAPSLPEAAACREGMSQVTQAAEEGVLVALQRAVDTFCVQAEKVLMMEQRRIEFRPDGPVAALFDRPTGACLRVTAMCDALYEAAKLHLEGPNLSSFLSTTGQRMHATLTNHMRQFIYTASGALRWKNDVSQYLESLTRWGVPSLTQRMASLHALTNILIVAPESLLGLVDGTLRMEHSEALKFIRLRLDSAYATVDGRSLAQLFTSDLADKTRQALRK
ncbi:MAG: hypothetical protein WDW38_006326 [Sanguina aurantia]